MDLKKLEPEEKLDEVQRTLRNLSKELQIVVKLFDLMTKSPEMVTRGLLLKAKQKVTRIFDKARETEKSLRRDDSLEELASDVGSMHPVMILDEVSRSFEQFIQTQLALYADDVTTLMIPDKDFEYVLRTLYNSAVRTQKGLNAKTCEISLSSAGKNMVLKFKDFGKSIPEEDIDHLFDGSLTSQDYAGGYPFYRMKRLLERAQGQIEVLSGKTKFTTFTIKIPFLKVG
ncbi:hypothetical protein HOF92_01560 [bacterium]|jgi:signal transduction histidine kinase|nr:hypothetical protein [bacterium]